MKILAILFLAAAAWAADKNPSAEKAVRDNVAAFNKAAREGDGATLSKLLSEDLFYGHSNAKIETKAEAVAALVKSKNVFEMKDGMTVQVYGNTAVVHGLMWVPANKFNLDIVQVWVKEGKDWRMVARHTTRLPQ